jgi:glucose-1-phosphate thymidylyltransferase
MKAIILAEGYADRLYPLTKDQPKALLPIVGRPIINYQLDEIEKIYEIDEVFVVTNETFAPNFQRWKEDNSFRSGLEITLVNNGTSNDDNHNGAVADLAYCIAGQNIDSDVLVLAGDTLVQFDFSKALQDFKRTGVDVVCGQKARGNMDLSRFAVAKIDADHYIVEITEKPTRTRYDIIIYAVYFLRRETLPRLNDYMNDCYPPEYLGCLIEYLQRFDPLYVHLFEGDCIDIETLTDYADVQLKLSNETR